MNFEEIKLMLAQYRQSHLLAHFATLSESEQNNLLKQIENIDFSLLKLIDQPIKETKESIIEPIKTLEHHTILSHFKEYSSLGLEQIRRNKVGLVLLAGGQGTRLGLDIPKGMLDVGISKPLYLFEVLINNILEVVKLAGNYIQLYIMTSNLNNEETIKFFKQNNYFNYPANYIHFFIQEMSPACDFEGKILLHSPSQIALSPNGNGGWFSSLVKANYLPQLKSQGIQWLNVFSVDNVLQKIADPIFLGALIANNRKCGSKVVRKINASERVGVICLKDTKPAIVEYYELSEEMQNARDLNGELLYNFGVTLNYFIQLDELINTVSSKLPVHIVEKKVPFFAGEYIEPKVPNGYKFETLILDMINLIGDCLPFEVLREKEFAPIKNADGNDSIITAQKLLRDNNIEL